MEQLKLAFQERLPKRPYCSNDLTYGVVIRPAAMAMQHRYIQANPHVLLSWLIFDIDRAGAADAWQDAGLPPPNIIAINRANGHAHLLYGITNPVCKSAAAHQKPLRYAAAIEDAYKERLGADLHYVGLLTKNPAHTDWLTEFLHPHFYDLADLADYVDLAVRKRSPAPAAAHGLWRNVSLFDTVRKWAYGWVDTYRQGGSLEAWHNAVYAQAMARNTFPEPLTEPEARATAKSIAKWTWRHFSKAESDARFSQLQSVRGKKGAAITNATRRAATTARIQEAIAQLQEAGKKPTKASVARLIGMSRQKISEDYSDLFG